MSTGNTDKQVIAEFFQLRRGGHRISPVVVLQITEIYSNLKLQTDNNVVRVIRDKPHTPLDRYLIRQISKEGANIKIICNHDYIKSKLCIKI